MDNLDDDDPQLLSDALSSLEEMEGKSGLGIEKQTEAVRYLLLHAEENCPPEDDDDDGRFREWSGGDQSIGNEALADMFSTLLQ